MVPLGVGMGMMMQNLVLAVQNAVPMKDLGTGTSTINFFRSMGGSFGTAVFGAVLTARLNHWLPLLLPSGSHAHVTASVVSAPQAVRALPAPVRSGIVRAPTTLMTPGAGMTVVWPPVSHATVTSVPVTRTTSPSRVPPFESTSTLSPTSAIAQEPPTTDIERPDPRRSGRVVRPPSG